MKELSRKTISINERAKKIEWVVAGSLKSYFYASLVFTQGKDLVVGFIKPSPVVRDGKSRTEKFGIGSEDAVVLVLGDINANVDYRGEFP